MTTQEYTKDFETLSNLHHATRETIETEVARVIDNIRIHKRLAAVLYASWTHHVMTHTVSEAGAGAQALLICKLLRDATTAMESLLRFTEWFLMCHSLLQYEALRDKPKSPLVNIRDKNIKEKVIKTLKKLDFNIKEMQQELDLIDGMVNTEATCMDQLKRVMRTMEQKLRSFASFTPQHEAMELPGSTSKRDEARATFAHDAEGEAIEVTQQEAPLSSEGCGSQDEDSPEAVITPNDDEYMAWLVEHHRIQEYDE